LNIWKNNPIEYKYNVYKYGMKPLSVLQNGTYEQLLNNPIIIVKTIATKSHT
jgi:hypothetical protein